LTERRNGKPAYDSIEDLVPNRKRLRLHVNLVHHGRAMCISRAPKCQQCILVSCCPMGRARVAENRTGPVAVELFAGGGGLGLGFSQAGFQIAIAVEQDRNAAQTYRLNHPGVPVVEADVTTVDDSARLRRRDRDGRGGGTSGRGSCCWRSFRCPAHPRPAAPRSAR
jgi:hypothetical protein